MTNAQCERDMAHIRKVQAKIFHKQATHQRAMDYEAEREEEVQQGQVGTEDAVEWNAGMLKTREVLTSIGYEVPELRSQNAVLEDARLELEQECLRVRGQNQALQRLDAQSRAAREAQGSEARLLEESSQRMLGDCHALQAKVAELGEECRQLHDQNWQLEELQSEASQSHGQQLRRLELQAEKAREARSHELRLLEECERLRCRNRQLEDVRSEVDEECRHLQLQNARLEESRDQAGKQRELLAHGEREVARALASADLAEAQVRERDGELAAARGLGERARSLEEQLRDARQAVEQLRAERARLQAEHGAAHRGHEL
ncbi:unnamed protein product, partial [Prorocentrum cordatum]